MQTPQKRRRVAGVESALKGLEAAAEKKEREQLDERCDAVRKACASDVALLKAVEALIAQKRNCVSKRALRPQVRSLVGIPMRDALLILEEFLQCLPHVLQNLHQKASLMKRDSLRL